MQDSSNNNANTLLVAIIDRDLKKLSKMQWELLNFQGISAEDYNEISDMIGTLKDYMVNCPSYKGNEKQTINTYKHGIRKFQTRSRKSP